MSPHDHSSVQEYGEIDARAAAAGVLSIPCGDVTLRWLAATTEVPDAQISSLLTPAEKERADGFKSLKRKTEFLRTRWLIRHLTQSRDPLLPGLHNAPTWPPGRVGSITHKDGHVAIALAPSQHLASLGIDAENADKVPESIATRVLVARELQLRDQILAQPLPTQSSAQRASPLPNQSRTLAVCFSFKEALFKCCFPLGETMFYFHDAEIIALDWQQGTIAARLLRDTSPRSREGDILTGHFEWIEITPSSWAVVSSVAIAAS